MDFEHKMVIVVRKDLKLSPGKMAAQVAHAAVNCALASKKRKPDAASTAGTTRGRRRWWSRSRTWRSCYQIKQAAEDARTGHLARSPTPG